MLVSMGEVLNYAKKNSCAVGSFNTPTLECITAVLHAAESLHVPVLLMHAQVHEPIAPIDTIGPVMVLEAERAKIPVAVMLDHGETIEYVQKALSLGFTGIMYDGSLLPYQENVENTKQAVALAHARGVQVEAEIGSLPSREDGGDVQPTGPVYTDPDLAVRFVEESGIDALAPSFGTAHGIYKSAPVLDLDRVKVIAERTGLPLVMHGGSGVSEQDYRTAIANGIRKINYYSYMSKAGTRAAETLLKTQDVTFYHDVAHAAQLAMEADAAHALKLFSGM